VEQERPGTPNVAGGGGGGDDDDDDRCRHGAPAGSDPETVGGCPIRLQAGTYCPDDDVRRWRRRRQQQQQQLAR
jgi:hypothetical protein